MKGRFVPVPFLFVEVNVFDEEELPLYVSGKVRILEDDTIEWLGDVTIIDRQCQDDWAEENSGNLSSHDLTSGRLKMCPLDEARATPWRRRSSEGWYVSQLFTLPFDNFEVLKAAYDTAAVVHAEKAAEKVASRASRVDELRRKQRGIS